MSAIIDLQLATECHSLPKESDIQLWLDTVLTELTLTDKEITVRIVDQAEIQQLNLQYRGKDKATNVLSFPFEMPELVFSPEGDEDNNEDISMTNFIGDLVICAQIVANEATQQNKLEFHHWAHMIIHGSLHLLGYDHIEDEDAQEMESLEIALLQKLAIDDPYQNH